ncbi:MAG: phosphoesterase [Sneathiella sp.]|nr:phosphoesterase [Sneathiella sp.]
MECNMRKPGPRFHAGYQLAISALLLALVIVLFEYTGLDFRISDNFFNGTTWIIDANQPVARFFFYNMPRWLLIAYGSGLCILFLLSFVLKPCEKFRTRKILFIILCAILIPLTVGTGKKITNVYCPYQLTEYGGTKPHLWPFEERVSDDSGKCFPAGHASAGFALLLFIPLARTRKGMVMAGAMTAGWIMGGYQMLNGRHFLSHTLVTMLLSWMIVCLLYFLVVESRFFKGNWLKS